LIQKEKDLRRSRPHKLVSNEASVSEPKAYIFSRSTPYTQTADVGRPRLEDEEHRCNSVRNYNLVSVLDLDNTACFSWQTHARSRKQPMTYARFFQPFIPKNY